MACLSDESWVSLPKMLSERLSLKGDKDEDLDDKKKSFVDSKTTQYRIEKVFPVYALGILKPDSDSLVLVSNSGDSIADPIWDAVKEEAKLEVQSFSSISFLFILFLSLLGCEWWVFHVLRILLLWNFMFIFISFLLCRNFLM